MYLAFDTIIINGRAIISGKNTIIMGTKLSCHIISNNIGMGTKLSCHIILITMHFHVELINISDRINREILGKKRRLLDPVSWNSLMNLDEKRKMSHFSFLPVRVDDPILEQVDTRSIGFTYLDISHFVWFNALQHGIWHFYQQQMGDLYIFKTFLFTCTDTMDISHIILISCLMIYAAMTKQIDKILEIKSTFTRKPVIYCAGILVWVVLKTALTTRKFDGTCNFDRVKNPICELVRE
ncbi:hypothetical protein ACJX0J_017157, partial [Zea mays]